MVLDMMRPETEYATARRTRQAGVALAQARLNAVFDALLQADIPDLSQRVKFAPPRFSEPLSDKGTITFYLVWNRAS